jgi:hypothetical protein
MHLEVLDARRLRSVMDCLVIEFGFCERLPSVRVPEGRE